MWRPLFGLLTSGDSSGFETLTALAPQPPNNSEPTYPPHLIAATTTVERHRRKPNKGVGNASATPDRADHAPRQRSVPTRPSGFETLAGARSSTTEQGRDDNS